jgi:hypothetical protein
METGTV